MRGIGYRLQPSDHDGWIDDPDPPATPGDAGGGGLLAMLLVVLGVTVDVSLGVPPQKSARPLLAATSRAEALAPRTLTRSARCRLNGGGVRALLVTADGAPTAIAASVLTPSPVDGPPPFAPRAFCAARRSRAAAPISRRPACRRGRRRPPPPPPPPDASATAVVRLLPDGSRVILVADTTQTTQVTHQLRLLMIGAGVITLLALRCSGSGQPGGVAPAGPLTGWRTTSRRATAGDAASGPH